MFNKSPEKLVGIQRYLTTTKIQYVEITLRMYKKKYFEIKEAAASTTTLFSQQKSKFEILTRQARQVSASKAAATSEQMVAFRKTDRIRVSNSRAADLFGTLVINLNYELD